jgi:serine/threonine protein phosphatase PrpC
VTAGLFVVADGMGGQEAGEIAARIAVSTMMREMANRLPGLAEDLVEQVLVRQVLEDAVRGAHGSILSAGSEENRMGTTLVAALVIDNMVYVANVGDSRAYFFDGKSLRQITVDHSLVALLASLGQIKKEEIYTHPRRNELTRALGTSGDLEIDIFCERLDPGQEILLCSDGMWGMVRDGDIEGVFLENLTLSAKADGLINLANTNGGMDNITAVVFKAVQPGSAFLGEPMEKSPVTS